MLKESKAFSTFAVDDVPKAKQFYGETLGLDVKDEMDGLALQLAAAAVSSSTRSRITRRRRSPSSTSRSTTSSRRSTG